MFGMSWAEIIIIVTVGMFVLGPERIPVAVKWVGSTLKTVRTMAAGAQEQLQGEFGPELEELKRQIADLQSLKEIQELRSLRDLNPRALITKNILGDEFSGGFTGLLGLNQAPGTPQATGSGVAAEPDSTPIVLPDPAPQEVLSSPPEVAPAPPEAPVPAVVINEPTAPATEAISNEPLTLTKPAGHPAAAPIDLSKPGPAEVRDVIPQTPAAGPRHLAAAYDLDAT